MKGDSWRFARATDVAQRTAEAPLRRHYLTLIRDGSRDAIREQFNDYYADQYPLRFLADHEHHRTRAALSAWTEYQPSSPSSSDSNSDEEQSKAAADDAADGSQSGLSPGCVQLRSSKRLRSRERDETEEAEEEQQEGVNHGMAYGIGSLELTGAQLIKASSKGIIGNKWLLMGTATPIS